MKIEKIDSLGCVMHPIYVNMTKPNTHFFFSKIEQECVLHNELAIYQIIANYPSSFYIFVTAEKITYNNFDMEQYDLSFSRRADSEFFLLKYPTRKLYSFKELCTEISNKSHYIRFLINTYTKLLNSIDILIQNNIVHTHIEYNNICIDENDEPLIAQFGLSIHAVPLNINIEYIRKFFTTYNPSYIYWPLEIHILSYILTNKMESISQLHIEQVIQDITSNNHVFIRLGYTEIYKKEGLLYLRKYINQPLEYIVNDIFRHKHTWDQYSLSVLFLDILLELERQKCTKNEFILSFIELLKCNIRNGASRLSLKDNFEKFDRLCYETDIKIFKELIARL